MSGDVTKLVPFFPNMASVATLELEWGSQEYLFISDETRSEFAQQNEIAID
jgi:hypothetical protein